MLTMMWGYEPEDTHGVYCVCVMGPMNPKISRVIGSHPHPVLGVGFINIPQMSSRLAKGTYEKISGTGIKSSSRIFMRHISSDSPKELVYPKIINSRSAPWIMLLP